LLWVFINGFQVFNIATKTHPTNVGDGATPIKFISAIQFLEILPCELRTYVFWKPKLDGGENNEQCKPWWRSF
jgi:hypothetical protein